MSILDLWGLLIFKPRNIDVIISMNFLVISYTIANTLKISFFSLKHLFLNLIETHPLGSTYLRIIVIVSFRSFPWKGSVPVSISNYKKVK